MIPLVIGSVTALVGDGYWKTSGSKILDSHGNVVKLAGVNCAETNVFAPHGLWSVEWKYVLDSIAAHGFNSLRLPWSNDLIKDPAPNGINYWENKDLEGKSALQVLDMIIDYCGKIGLKVVLDRHRPDSNAQSPLWYTDAVPESVWIKDWITMANRYKGNPTVIGADLHNEPHGDACWGCGDLKRDWRLAAERCGNAILEVEPNWLIFVEGVEFVDGDHYWWGGNLAAAGRYPVRLNVPDRLVYSVHDYSEDVALQSWFHNETFPADMVDIYDKYWGYLAKENIAPVWVGEFGSNLSHDTDDGWLNAITSYIKETGSSWTFWCWNPNSGDTGGLVGNDWKTFDTAKDAYLQKIKFPFKSVTQPKTFAHKRISRGRFRKTRAQ